MKLLLITLSMLYSTSILANDTSLIDAIKNTNLLSMKSRPVIKFKADPKANETISCKANKDHTRLQVTMNPSSWYAQNTIGQTYSFCRVMHECDKRIKCPALRSYTSK